MTHWLDSAQAWMEIWETQLWWLAAASAIMFVGSLIAIPFFALRIPHDYFLAPERIKTPWGGWPPLVRGLFIVLKNLAGVVLILAGVAMLILPGQGLLTILLGLVLTNFPGKYRLERRLVSHGPVLRGINWIRERRSVPPLRIGEDVKRP